MRIVRCVGQLVRTFYFQNSNSVDGRTPAQHEVQMGLDGHALMLPVNFKLGQDMQAQRRQLQTSGPVAGSTGGPGCQQWAAPCGPEQHEGTPSVGDVAHAHIGGAVSRRAVVFCCETACSP